MKIRRSGRTRISRKGGTRSHARKFLWHFDHVVQDATEGKMNGIGDAFHSFMRLNKKA